MSAEPAYVTVQAGLFDPKHVEAMGTAVWTFLLLTHWQTDPDGTVCRGRAINRQEIADRLGLSDRTVYDHLALLDEAGYITRRRSRYGVVVAIANPKKKLARAAESRNPERQNPAIQNGRGLPLSNSRTAESRDENGRFPQSTPYIGTENTYTIDAPKDDASIGRFDEWWKSYPRKVGKVEARKAHTAIVAQGKLPVGATRDDLDGLTTAAARHGRLMETAPAWAREFQERPVDKIPHGSTFLRRLDWVAAPTSPSGGRSPRTDDRPDELYDRAEVMRACRAAGASEQARLAWQAGDWTTVLELYRKAKKSAATEVA